MYVGNAHTKGREAFYINNFFARDFQESQSSHLRDSFHERGDNSLYAKIQPARLKIRIATVRKALDALLTEV